MGATTATQMAGGSWARRAALGCTLRRTGTLAAARELARAEARGYGHVQGCHPRGVIDCALGAEVARQRRTNGRRDPVVTSRALRAAPQATGAEGIPSDLLPAEAHASEQLGSWQ